MAGTQPARSHSGVAVGPHARLAGHAHSPVSHAYRCAVHVVFRRAAAHIGPRPGRRSPAVVRPRLAHTGAGGRGLHGPRWTGKPPAQKRPPFITLWGHERRAVPSGTGGGNLPPGPGFPVAYVA